MLGNGVEHHAHVSTGVRQLRAAAAQHEHLTRAGRRETGEHPQPPRQAWFVDVCLPHVQVDGDPWAHRILHPPCKSFALTTAGLPLLCLLPAPLVVEVPSPDQDVPGEFQREGEVLLVQETALSPSSPQNGQLEVYSLNMRTVGVSAMAGALGWTDSAWWGHLAGATVHGSACLPAELIRPAPQNRARSGR